MTDQNENSAVFVIVFEVSVAKAKASLPSSTPVTYVGSLQPKTFEMVMKWMTHKEDLNGNHHNLNSLFELMKAAKLLEKNDLFEWAALKIAEILNDSEEIGAAIGAKLLESQNQLKRERSLQIIPYVAAAPSTTIFNLVPEVWDFIFPYLSVTDFRSIINSSETWRETFKREIADRLLPLWLPIFIKNSRFSSTYEVLRWHKVNKAARSIIETIDNLLEESISPTNCYNNVDRSIMIPATGNVIEAELRYIFDDMKHLHEFVEPKLIQTFMDNMMSTSSTTLSSQFTTKSLELGLVSCSEPEERQYKELVLTMISQFGHEISNFSLEVNDFDLPYISTLLSPLPNLKVLKFGGYMYAEFEEENVARWEPIVKLEHLEFLDVTHLRENNFGALLTPLLHCCGSQLTRISCGDDLFDKSSNTVKLLAGGYPNLRFFRVRYMGYGFINTFWNPELDGSLPLEEIQFVEHEFDDVTLNDILRNIRRFGNTLVHLKLCFLCGFDENEDDFLEPLPHLSKFTTELAYIHEEWFQAFVQLQSQQLTELNFEVDFVKTNLRQQDIDEVTQFFRILPNLTKINILRGFNSYVSVSFDYRNAERIEIEREGAVRKFKFEYPTVKSSYSMKPYRL